MTLPEFVPVENYTKQPMQTDGEIGSFSGRPEKPMIIKHITADQVEYYRSLDGFMPVEDYASEWTHEDGEIGMIVSSKTETLQSGELTTVLFASEKIVVKG